MSEINPHDGPGSTGKTLSVSKSYYFGLFTMAAGIMVLLPLIINLSSAAAFTGVGLCAQMAIHAAVIFIVVAIGVIMLQPADRLMWTVTSNTMCGWMLRRLLPLLIGISIVLDWVLGTTQYGYFESSIGAVSVMVFMMLFLAGLAWWSAKALNRFGQDRQQQSKVMESEECYRGIFAGMPDGIIVHDADGVILDTNIVITRRLELPREKILGSNLAEFVTPDNVAAIGGHVANALKGELQIFETTYVSASGRTVPTEVRERVIPWKNGQAILSISRDITERRKAEMALQDSEVRYRRLFETDKDGILLLDFDTGMITDVNNFINELLGYSHEELLGMHLWDVGPFKDVVSSKDAFLRLQAEDYIRYEDLPLETRDGRKVEVEFISNVYQADGRKFIQCNIRDITGRRRAEVEKAGLEAQLRHSQKMDAIGQLAGGVAHDFNNMLSVINGYAAMLLLEVPPSDRKYPLVQEISKAGKRSADLTRQLLAFARRQTIAPEVLDLNASVAGMLNMLQRLIGENIELTWKPAANLWKVKMDPSQLDQILANLIVNARDAVSGAGRIAIETGKADLDEAFCRTHLYSVQGKYVILSVSDNGCGMDKKTLEHIYEPFFTTKKVGEGTGLGLATVFGIVKQNNGIINVNSEPGKGTTFKIYLPQHESENREGDEKPEEPGMLIRGTETILLLEDEKALLQFAKTLLERLGYTVLTAGSPGQAIRLAGEYKGDIHLLMTDMIMPEMNGQDLKGKINEIRSGIKCLFMSGYTADVMSRNGVLDKGIHFLQKPFTAEDLSVKLREALS